ncbi:hypothetical protein CSUI_005069, partial [Cystoisospora suis]
AVAALALTSTRRGRCFVCICDPSVVHTVIVGAPPHLLLG